MPRAKKTPPIDEGLELSKLFSLKRAGMLDQKVIEEHIKSDTYRKVGNALATQQFASLNKEERALYDMVEAI